MKTSEIAVLRQGFNAILIPPAPTQKATFVFTPYDPGQLLAAGQAVLARSAHLPTSMPPTSVPSAPPSPRPCP